jgi:hypothetical protein
VGFEASGGYEKPMAAYLSDKGYDVVQVKSYAVKRHREMVNGNSWASQYLATYPLCPHLRAPLGPRIEYTEAP